MVLTVGCPVRGTRDANRTSSCGEFNHFAEWSFRSIYDPWQTHYEGRGGDEVESHSSRNDIDVKGERRNEIETASGES